MALKWYPSCSHTYILAQGRPWLFGGPVQNKKWRPLFTIKIQDTSSIHHKNCYINHLPRKSSSSPFGIPRSNSGASMRASGRRKTGSVVFPHGPRQLIIASPRRNCRNEETMVNMINGWYCSITVANYELIRFIRFVSRKSTQLSKNIYKQILFNTIK